MAGVSLPTSVKPLLPLADSTSLKAGTMWSKLADCDSKSTSGLDRIGTKKQLLSCLLFKYFGYGYGQPIYADFPPFYATHYLRIVANIIFT